MEGKRQKDEKRKRLNDGKKQKKGERKGGRELKKD